MFMSTWNHRCPPAALFGNRYDYLRFLRWNYPGFRLGPKTSNWCFYKRRGREIWTPSHTHTHREDSHVNAVAETEVIRYIYKPRNITDCHKPQMLRRGQQGAFPELSEGTWHLDSRPLASKTVNKGTFCGLSHPVCDHRKLIHVATRKC